MVRQTVSFSAVGHFFGGAPGPWPGKPLPAPGPEPYLSRMTPTVAPVVTDFAQLDPSARYTYADYLRWQFGEAVELIRGKILRKMAGPVRAHQRISGNLHAEIHSFLKHKPCQVYAAPFDVRLVRGGPNGDADISTVVQPDLCVVCDPAKLDDRGCLGAPDWIIEIVSPRTARLDTATKYELYAENGVREYWLVFPKEQVVQAFTLTEAGEYQLVQEYDAPGLLPSHTLPALQLEWADVFADE